jgi:hypothetical protein
MKVFNDIKEGDIIYFIDENNIDRYPMWAAIGKSKVYDTSKFYGYKVIYYGGGKFRIPFNHLKANRLKFNNTTLFLNEKAFRKYCFKNVENLIESEETK